MILTLSQYDQYYRRLSQLLFGIRTKTSEYNLENIFLYNKNLVVTRVAIHEAKYFINKCFIG